VSRIRRLLGAAIGALTDTPTAPLLALAIVAGAGVVVQSLQPINHDVGWLLIAAGRLIDGAGVYSQDVIETNPPLILYLLALPVWVGRALGGAEIACFKAFTLSTVAVSLFLCSVALDSSLTGRGRGKTLGRWLLFAFGLGVLLTRPAEFGQREYFLLLLVLPYIFLAAARCSGSDVSSRWTVGLIGVCAGIAISLKPHYIVAMLPIELYVAARRRSLQASLRLETIVAIAFGLGYLASLVFLTPNYLEQILPLLRDAYWAYRKPAAEIIGPFDGIIFVVGSLCAVALMRSRGAKDLAAVLWLAGVSFYGAQIFQGTGWGYTHVPYLGVVKLLVALAVLVAIDALAARIGTAANVPRWRAAVAGALAILLGVSLVLRNPDVEANLRDFVEGRSNAKTAKLRNLGAFIDRSARGEPAYFLSVGMAHAFPAINHSHTRWASRFPCLWLLPAVLRARQGEPVPPTLTPQRANEIDRYIIDAVIEDLTREKPGVIFVDLRRKHQAYVDPDFQILAYFLEDPRFREIFAEYDYDPRPVFGSFAAAVRREAR